MSLTHAFWTLVPGRGEIRAEPLPEPGPGEARVRTLYSGISRGTERLVFNGRIPPSEHQRMRAPFQQGDFADVVKYGYASVGVVEALGPCLPGEGTPDRLGREVFCLFPHQHRYVVPVTALTPLPAGLPAGRAVLAANMETAVNALWDASPAVGDRIVIVGAGVVGCLVAFLCARIPGAEVSLVDVDPTRAAIAHALGVDFCRPEAAPSECDLVIHASGHPAGLDTALGLAGAEATVLEMSWYGAQSVCLPLGEAFHVRRLNLRSSQVGSIPPLRRPRWDYRRRLGLALSLLLDTRLDALFSGESDFFQLPAQMPLILAEGASTLCHRVRYPSTPDAGD